MHTTHLGDHIGMESCIDLNTDTDTDICTAPSNGKPCGRNKKSSSMSIKNTKSLPPPMMIPTSTVLKRYYTDDGRLIILEEKMDNPTYLFTAHRSKGRLTLQLNRSDNSSSSRNGGDFGVKYNDAVRVATTGPCLFVDHNQLYAESPVKIQE